MTLDNINTAITSCFKEAEIHRLAAEENIKINHIFTSRMAANHIMISIAAVLMEVAKEVRNETPSA